MKIHGFNKLTLLDYPGKLACTIFTGGCNFRCPFCHNASLVLNPDSQPFISEEDVLKVLENRKNVLEGVCISGGEPTINKDLPHFIKKIKDIGYSVKLDTNGFNPFMLRHLLNNRLIDYIAMDIKNSKEKYAATCGMKQLDFTLIEKSIKLIMRSNIQYEFRTTVTASHHNKWDFLTIGKMLSGAEAYYLQTFKDSGDIIGEGLLGYANDELEEIKELLSDYIELVEIRS